MTANADKITYDKPTLIRLFELDINRIIEFGGNSIPDAIKIKIDELDLIGASFGVTISDTEVVKIVSGALLNIKQQQRQQQQLETSNSDRTRRSFPNVQSAGVQQYSLYCI